MHLTFIYEDVLQCKSQYFFEFLIHAAIEIFQNSNHYWSEKKKFQYIFHVNISYDCVDPIARRFKARCFCTKSLLINSKTLKESWTLAAARRSPFSSLAGWLKMINKILICVEVIGKRARCHTASKALWSKLYKKYVGT